MHKAADRDRAKCRDRHRDGADQKQPRAPKDGEQQEQNREQRRDRIQRGFFLEQSLGLEGDAVASGIGDSEGWRMAERGAGAHRARDLSFDGGQPLEQTTAEGAIEGRPGWCRDDQPTAAIGRDVTALGGS